MPGGRDVDVTVRISTELAPAAPPDWLPLTDDDRTRLTAFRNEDDARRFVTARLLVADQMRSIGVPLSEVRLVRRRDTAGEWKPVLRSSGSRNLPSVSLSHSRSWVVAAFAHGAQVGIDVEAHAAFDPLDREVLSHVFTPRELLGVSTPRDAAVLFTRKEAVLKALGFGFAIDPLTLELDGCRVHRFDSPEARPLSLSPLTVPGAASAALALC
ncbi:4'-phosphopantetheinyl transferase superfamily protein [Rathayibacter sp. VKM Ac-2879]|nr:4'-phosphopantetheinyl transferase superfamily protein [Rathayibacter sp. VKM Ac-2879]